MSGSTRSDELVTLVDPDGKPVGEAGKLAAHQHGGQLHLAFSIFVFNSGGQLLLQKRAAAKYHFAGLWSNSCCGHPRPGEKVTAAAERRLKEEFGFSTPLREEFCLTYEAFDESSGLTEREFLHVLSGQYDARPDPNPDEIGGWRWQDPDGVLSELSASSHRYTPWFRMLAPRMLAGVSRPKL